VSGVAMAEVAVAMSRLKPGQAARVKGFLNRKNRMSAQLMFHATEAQAIKE
jgi:primosomal replication protein N